MRKIINIGWVTYKELINGKIFYSIFPFIIIVLFVSTFYGKVTIGDQIHVIKDLGLMCISIFSVSFSCIAGGVLLHKEINRKTIYNILSKSVYRYEFLIGKYLGTIITVFSLIFLNSIILSFYLYFFESKIDLDIWKAYYCMFLESIIVCSFSILFSTIVITPLLVSIFTISVFVTGRNLNSIQKFTDQIDTQYLKYILKSIYKTMPDLALLNISNDIVYGILFNFTYLIFATLYSVFYVVLVLLISSLLFRNKEF